MVSNYRRKRHALARHLRHLREQSGMSGNQFAKVLGWPQSKVSRLETGAQLPTEEDIRAWADALDVSKDEYGLMLQLLEQAEVEYRSKRHEFRKERGAQTRQRSIQNLEANSDEIHYFQLCLIPGLLQTFDYAKAVLSSPLGIQRYGAAETDIDETVTLRMERQSVLYDTRKTLCFALPEACLRTRNASKETQRGQIQRLIDMTSLPNIVLGVIPFDHVLPRIPTNGFRVYDNELVVIETMSGETQLSAHDDVELYVHVFDGLLDIGLKGDDAATFMRDVLKTL